MMTTGCSRAACPSTTGPQELVDREAQDSRINRVGHDRREIVRLMKRDQAGQHGCGHRPSHGDHFQ
jgi:hypothetical protein